MFMTYEFENCHISVGTTFLLNFKNGPFLQGIMR